jgi:hypothetical protein
MPGRKKVDAEAGNIRAALADLQTALSQENQDGIDDAMTKLEDCATRLSLRGGEEEEEDSGE